MTARRPPTLILASLANLLIGAVATIAGLGLLVPYARVLFTWLLPGRFDELSLTTWAMGIAAYGALEVAGALGTWRRSYRGWILALVIDLVSVAISCWSWATTLPFDRGLPIGVAIWGMPLALLLAPTTRDALRR